MALSSLLLILLLAAVSGCTKSNDNQPTPLDFHSSSPERTAPERVSSAPAPPTAWGRPELYPPVLHFPALTLDQAKVAFCPFPTPRKIVSPQLPRLLNGTSLLRRANEATTISYLKSDLYGVTDREETAWRNGFLAALMPGRHEATIQDSQRNNRAWRWRMIWVASGVLEGLADVAGA